jgi:hypothetical protein
MLAYHNLRAMTLALTAAIVGAISACHWNSVAPQPPSVQKVAETAFGPNGLVDAELTPPFDETPVTPRETVGATIEWD